MKSDHFKIITIHKIITNMREVHFINNTIVLFHCALHLPSNYYDMLFSITINSNIISRSNNNINKEHSQQTTTIIMMNRKKMKKVKKVIIISTIIARVTIITSMIITSITQLTDHIHGLVAMVLTTTLPIDLVYCRCLRR